MKDFEVLLEKVLAHFAGEQFKDEVRMAKIEFFENAGILDEASDHFELRMSQFFDWYFFTRKLSGFQQTPLEAAHMPRELRFSTQENEVLERLKQTRHSLFEFIKFKNKELTVRDLFKDKKITIPDCPWTYGFNSEELFEARLVPYNSTFAFTKGVCFHPPEANKFILSEIKKHRKDPDLNPDIFMLRLIKMRYKYERYKHVKLEQIYSNENKVGI
ncbi:MAG: hypothetical protein AB7H97_03670 [Pseudobdellovibrionaceae bacterium]